MSGFVRRFRLKGIEQALLRACRLANRSKTSAPPKRRPQSRKWPSSIRRTGKSSARCSTICWTSIPSERVARLAEIRRTDPQLATDLEILLARETVIDREAFLEGSALPKEATLAGKVIGSYTVDRLLGQGGMGSVWLAHRSDGRFEGQAAVKFLNLALMGRGGAERFRREGQVLAKLVHPGIARLIDAGIVDGGQPYLMLEYIDGEPIDAGATRTRLISSRACACSSRCCAPSSTRTAT